MIAAGPPLPAHPPQGVARALVHTPCAIPAELPLCGSAFGVLSPRRLSLSRSTGVPPVPFPSSAWSSRSCTHSPSPLSIPPRMPNLNVETFLPALFPSALGFERSRYPISKPPHPADPISPVLFVGQPVPQQRVRESRQPSFRVAVGHGPPLSPVFRKSWLNTIQRISQTIRSFPQRNRYTQRLENRFPNMRNSHGREFETARLASPQAPRLPYWGTGPLNRGNATKGTYCLQTDVNPLDFTI